MFFGTSHPLTSFLYPMVCDRVAFCLLFYLPFIYMDDLLLELERAGVGCFWRHHYVGAVCYADDLALLAPSLSALRIMLDICIHYASSHSLIFNASKTQLIRFSRSDSFCRKFVCSICQRCTNGTLPQHCSSGGNIFYLHCLNYHSTELSNLIFFSTIAPIVVCYNNNK